MTAATEPRPEPKGWLATQDRIKVEAAMNTLPADSDSRSYSNGDPYFALYLHIADRKCGNAVGLSIFDLADYLWYDAYENGTTPSRAVREALEGDDTFASMFGGEGE
jgi:hypothetical protein